MNGGLVKANFRSLIILLNSGASSLVVLVKHIKIRKKETQPVKWSTQVRDFLTTHTTNVEFVLPELDDTKSVT